VAAGTLVWLAPTLAATFAWGIAQGLVKKYIGEVPPARFCLYYAVANAAVNLLFWHFSGDKPAPFAAEHARFATWGIAAYVLDGIAWIFYYQSIVHGPITIVGTLSAAYPALTVLFARAFLNEVLSVPQYAGVALVLGGCLGLAYSPSGASDRRVRARWAPLAAAALLIWGANGALIRYAYGLPGASEANMALFIAIGGLATLGVYGAIAGSRGAAAGWARAMGPMAAMALGGLFAAIAFKAGPASIVTPLSGAYPVVTLGFAAVVLKERPTRLHWACIVAILAGVLLTTIAPG
jgi:drug/metabolite transporter (DMT)-like permease